jgi:A/G-specific adenine glycosylase
MTDFHLLIKDWYRLNKRDLPWRKTTSAYKIWLSEIILQQTRVDQGLSYYQKFSETYPTIHDLAMANEDDILRNWQGLGYYSRARNMHATAKEIVEKLNGEFPKNYKEIRELKGIGDYTAAAISSFAFNLPHAVVDGNVYRVLSRVFNIDTPIDSTEGKKQFSSLAEELIDERFPAIHNQAIMELGALVCTPKNPNCSACPLNSKCLARAEKTIEFRPLKSKKTKVRNRYFHFLIFETPQEVVIEKRKDKDIWQHLFQFPLQESDRELSPDAIEESVGLSPSKSSEPIIHLLSHQRISARFYHFDTIPEIYRTENKIIQKSKLSEFALPRLIDRYLEENGWSSFVS